MRKHVPPPGLAAKAMTTAFVVAIGSFSALDASAAVPITGLYNTGALSGNGSQDTNYKLSKTGGDGPAIGSYGYDSGGWTGFPFGPWLANTGDSQWLTPTANPGATFDATSNATYTWRLGFNLTGYDPATASFSGRWATDNNATIKLNGNALASTTGTQDFGKWTAFSSAGGFINGANTLDFIVTNIQLGSGNPTGLRVEFLASAVTAVPEADGYAMMLAGLGLVGFVSRRRMRTGALA